MESVKKRMMEGKLRTMNESNTEVLQRFAGICRQKMVTIRKVDDDIQKVLSLFGMDVHKKTMQKTIFGIRKVCKCFPPAENMNKFIYGKLCEMILIDMFDSLGFVCTDLDSTHNVGSEYINDIGITHPSLDISMKFSIKTSKSGGKVTIINKRNVQKHDFKWKKEVCFIMLQIEKSHIYVFRNNDDFTKYIHETGDGIHFKSGIFTFLKKSTKYTYQFPELSEEQEKELDNVQPVDGYQVLKDYLNL